MHSAIFSIKKYMNNKRIDRKINMLKELRQKVRLKLFSKEKTVCANEGCFLSIFRLSY